MAFFGGDVDNFEFPRWNLDFGFFRVYENGKPAATPNYLRVRRSGAAAGEPVFVSGHPGSTQRLDTVAQLRFQRDLVLNHWLLRGNELRGRYLQFATGSPESSRIVEEDLFNVENVLKVRRNQMDVLLDEGFLAEKSKDEQALRNAVAADAKLKPYAGAWSDIEKALDDYRSFFDRYTFLERGAALQGDLAYYARVLVRAGMEREKPNEARQREYTEAALPLLRQQVLAPAPVYLDLETLRLTFSLEKLVEFLGLDDPAVRLALGRDSPRNLATRLVRETKLGDPAYRDELWNGGRAALEKSGDPLITLALRLEPDAQQVRKRYEDEVEAPILAAEEKIARARFAVKGKSTYPDATFTLRLSFGAVAGLARGGSRGAALHDHGRPVRARDGPAPVPPACPLGAGAGARESRHALQLHHHQRHHRRQFRQPGRGCARAAGRADLRRQHPFHRRRLLVRPHAEPRDRRAPRRARAGTE